MKKLSGITDKRALSFMSDRIEDLLDKHDIGAIVLGGTVGPRWIKFKLAVEVGTRVRHIKGLSNEIAMVLDVDNVFVSRSGSRIFVQIPRKDPRHVNLFSLIEGLPRVPFGAAVLGVKDDTTPLMVKITSPTTTHVLIAGITGSGKTVLTNSLVGSIAMTHRPSEFQFVLIDPKYRAFGRFENMPHLLRPIVNEVESSIDALRDMENLMLYRDKHKIQPFTKDLRGDPRIVVVIDELADLMLASKREVEDSLTRLLQRGRASGMHIIAATQKPSSAVVGSLVKSNFSTRLVGRTASPEDAKVASGYAKTGAENLSLPGDFLAVIGGQIVKFQAAIAEGKFKWEC